MELKGQAETEPFITPIVTQVVSTERTVNTEVVWDSQALLSCMFDSNEDLLQREDVHDNLKLQESGNVIKLRGSTGITA